MSDTNKMIHATIDEIVEAVVSQAFGLEAIRDSVIAEDDTFLITPNEIRTALEGLVRENSTIHDIVFQMKAHLNVIESIDKGLSSASPETRAYSEGSLVQLRFWCDRISKITTPTEKGGEG